VVFTIGAACTQPRCADGARQVSGVCQRSFESDAGEENDGGEPLVCVDMPCPDTETELLRLVACCDEATGGLCGVHVPDAVPVPLSGCFAKHQAGSVSHSCGALLDQLDAPLTRGVEPGNDGAYTFAIGDDVVALPGCCMPTGECGVVYDEVSIAGKHMTIGAGCVPLSRLETLGADGSAGKPSIFPFCVPDRPDDEACPPALTVGDLNLCDELAAQGVALVGCDPSAPTPLWVCAARALPTIDDGEVPADVGDCMEYVPEFVSGCGLGVQASLCISNVDESRYGCVDVDALPAEEQNVLLATVTAYACGCGDGVAHTNGICIPNLGTTLCGSKPAVVDTRGTATTEDDCLVSVPEYAHGCGEDAEPTPQNMCLRHAPQIYGCVEISWSDIPGLPGIPNVVCGCGDEQLGENCLKNVPESLCGAVARCTEGETGSAAGDPTHCAEGEVCSDLKGVGGAVGEPPGDDIGDSCVASS
jgi:hypothetical protein